MLKKIAIYLFLNLRGGLLSHQPTKTWNFFTFFSFFFWSFLPAWIRIPSGPEPAPDPDPTMMKMKLLYYDTYGIIFYIYFLHSVLISSYIISTPVTLTSF